MSFLRRYFLFLRISLCIRCRVNIFVGVMELADVMDSKSILSDGVRVQVPPPAFELRARGKRAFFNEYVT